MIDQAGRGYVTTSELHDVLRDFEYDVHNVYNVDDCKLLFLRYNRECDGMLRYSEFTDAFMPIDRHHSRLLGTKQLKYS